MRSVFVVTGGFLIGACVGATFGIAGIGVLLIGIGWGGLVSYLAWTD